MNVIVLAQFPVHEPDPHSSSQVPERECSAPPAPAASAARLVQHKAPANRRGHCDRSLRTLGSQTRVRRLLHLRVEQTGTAS